MKEHKTYLIIYCFLCTLLIASSCKKGKSVNIEPIDITEKILEDIEQLNSENSVRNKAFLLKLNEEVRDINAEHSRFLEKINLNQDAIDGNIFALASILAPYKYVSKEFRKLYDRLPSIEDDIRHYYILLEGIKRAYSSIPTEVNGVEISAESLKNLYEKVAAKKIQESYDRLIFNINDVLSNLNSSFSREAHAVRTTLQDLEASLKNYNDSIRNTMNTEAQLLETNIRKLAINELAAIHYATNEKTKYGIQTIIKQLMLTIENNTLFNDLNSVANINTCKQFHQALAQAYQLAQATKANAALVIFNTTIEGGVLFAFGADHRLRTMGENFAIVLYKLTTPPPQDPTLATLSPGAFRDVFMETMTLNPVAPPAGVVLLNGYANTAAAIADGGAKKIWLGLKEHVDRYGNTIPFPNYTAAGGAACKNLFKTDYKDNGGRYYIELA